MLESTSYNDEFGLNEVEGRPLDHLHNALAPIDCNREKAYLAIIITVLPLWAILTTLIVFVLLTFHRNLRATKVYDNCAKTNAKFLYYVELRTGETSVTYIKRKTIISIDMFDENLSTVARIAVPGHLIFGKRNRPSNIFEDDKYPELRITKFWLYRASKLKRVSTIRLTHSCSEPEAKIMVYGIQLRGDSIEDKLFFPIMSYISAYGSATKPNVCFDHEPTGTISAMGGSQHDEASINGQLCWADYILLIYLLLSLIFYISSSDLINNNSSDDYSQACIKGIVVGTIGYMIVFVLGLFFRYIIKQNYSIRIGTGFWALVYYSFCLGIFLISTAVWILTTIKSYKSMCPDNYVNWLVAISLAILLSAVLTVFVTCISWIIQLVNPKSMEQYMFPDEQFLGSHEQGSKSHQAAQNPFRYHHGLPMQKTPLMSPMAYGQQQSNQAGSWQTNQQYLPFQGANMYSQPLMMNPMLNSPSYKTLQTTYNPGYEPQTTLPAVGAPQQQQNQTTTYHQQTSATQAGTRAPAKKLGSNESTGSNYYQQLMKNKGGVKSISQYGELLRQKKGIGKQTAIKRE